jgi:hypothetical protein
MEWDKKGNVIAVALSTINEEEYLIENNAQGEEMLQLIQKEVEVCGEVKEDESGQKSVVVQHYKVIPL